MEFLKSHKDAIMLSAQIIMWFISLVISYFIGKGSKKEIKKSILYSIKQELRDNLALIDGNINYCELNSVDQIDSTEVEVKLKSNKWDTCLSQISYIKNKIILDKLSDHYRHISMTQLKEKQYVPIIFLRDMKDKSEEILELINIELKDRK